jgi:hypothetical protein
MYKYIDAFLPAVYLFLPAVYLFTVIFVHVC